MAYWTIKCYCNAQGRDLFDKEYTGQSAAVRAEFRATLNGLKDQPDITGWSRPNGFDRLSGKYRELGKLRFKADRIQQRPLGFFGPEKNEFTLLVWATERDGDYHPPDVRETALKRMKEVLKEPTRAHECNF